MEKSLYELTNPQKNIFELQKVNNDNENIAHIFASLQIKGCLDTEILKETLNLIMQKNDAFKLRFIEKDSHPYQYIENNLPKKDFEVRTFDTEDISDFVNEYKLLPLNLSNLVSFAIAKTPKYTYVLYKTHHIIADGWSMTQVSEQIKEIYCKLLNKEPLDSYRKPSYLDFIKREEEYINSTRYTTDFNFWKDYTSKITDTNRLFQSQDVFNKTSKRFDYPISPILYTKIEEFCKQNNITEYVFFLAIFSIYFSKIYSTKSLVFGTPFLNRQKKNDEMDCAGLFVSTLPLLINIDKEMDFIELCRNISSTNFSIYKHCHFPYHKIENLYHSFSNDNTNIYEIGFSYQINELQYKMPNGDPGNFNWYFLGIQNNPLTIHLTIPDHKRMLSYDYWTSCFDEKDIINMNMVVLHIIDQVLEYKKNDDIDLLCDKDTKFLKKFTSLGKINKSNYSVPDLFKTIVRKYPNKTAVICGSSQISYKDLDEKSDALANLLAEKGLTKGDSVALFFEKSINMIISILSVLKAGGCYVPILPDEETSRVQYILNNCSPLCILSESNFLNRISTDIPIYCLDKLNLNLDIDYHSPAVSHDVAYMIYTSGSTGNPKGTMVMHKNICDLMQSISNDDILHATHNDISMSLLKYSFDASGIDIYTSLLFGGTLVLVSKEDELNPSKVLNIIEKYKVTRSFLIPKWLEHISIEDACGKYDLSSLRILGAGGETLKPSVISPLLKHYPNLKILNLYGPTETTMLTTCKIVKEEEVTSNYTTIGRPIYGSRLAVVNSNLEFLPPNTKGELIVYEDDTSISNIAKGYLKLPEQTNKKFIEIYNPIINKKVKAYLTGDMAKINDNYEIEFLGRDDDIVKVNGGYLVALNEIEDKIQKLLGDYFDSYLIVVPFKNTKMIILFIVPKEQNIKIYNIKSYINNNITFYMRPKKIIKIDSFPRNSSGKIDRKKLKQIAEDYLSSSSDSIVLPSTKTEKELLQILKKFVTIETLSITDDFIDDLGIDSLTLTSFFSCLESYNISIQDVYNNPNIKDLASFIDNKKSITKLELNLTDIDKSTITNNVHKFDLSEVLLTGVTGFLGIHLLKDLLYSKETKKIYCIIRNKINLDGRQRLDKMIKFYFNSNPEILSLIHKKVVILNGDITKDFLGLDDNIYNNLRKKVTTVINSAANVRHYVKPKRIKKDNVESVNKLIDFCGTNISLSHISTLSITGFYDEINNKIFDENSLYVNQELNNPYLVSKFEAEKNILYAINNSNLNANIFRMGNIMPRIEDGIFQENANQNAFLTAIKFIVNSKVIPEKFADMPIEFSPVDECSKFVVELIKRNLPFNIYHIANNNNFTFADFKNLLSELNIDLNIVDIDTFKSALENYADEYTKEYLLNNKLSKFSQDRTLKNLHDINLYWKKIDLNYIKLVLNCIK